MLVHFVSFLFNLSNAQLNAENGTHKNLVKTYCTLDVVPFYGYAQVIHSFTSFPCELPVRYHDLLLSLKYVEKSVRRFSTEIITFRWINDFDVRLKNHGDVELNVLLTIICVCSCTCLKWLETKIWTLIYCDQKWENHARACVWYATVINNAKCNIHTNEEKDCLKKACSKDTLYHQAKCRFNVVQYRCIPMIEHVMYSSNIEITKSIAIILGLLFPFLPCTIKMTCSSMEGFLFRAQYQ